MRLDPMQVKDSGHRNHLLAKGLQLWRQIGYEKEKKKEKPRKTQKTQSSPILDAFKLYLQIIILFTCK